LTQLAQVMPWMATVALVRGVEAVSVMTCMGRMCVCVCCVEKEGECNALAAKVYARVLCDVVNANADRV
jgi:hypothetical protein